MGKSRCRKAAMARRAMGGLGSAAGAAAVISTMKGVIAGYLA
jgi:hypothetical protein